MNELAGWLSICMIAKNEEKHIENCLKPLSSLGAEIIVVDTGSADQTTSLCRKYTNHIYHFDWCDDFSAARNYSISKAANDYILVVDFDEYLINADIHELFQLKQCEKAGMILRQNPTSSEPDSNMMVERVARFFHRNYYHYTGRIHEQVTALSDTEIQYYNIPLTFLHKGYESAEDLKQKALRNIRLLLMDLEQNGSNPYTCFQLGQSYKVLKDTRKALEYYDLGLSFDVDPALTYVQTMVEAYGYCLLELGEIERALQLENIFDVFCKRADFVFLMGHIYMNAGLFDLAISQFEKATTIADYATAGTNSYLAWYNEGVVYEVLGNTEKAVACYKRCGNFSKALERLKFLCKSG